MTLIDAVGTDGADPGSGWSVAGTSNGTKDKALLENQLFVFQTLIGLLQVVQTLQILSDCIRTKHMGLSWISLVKCSNSLSISGTFQTSNQSINISVELMHNGK